MQITATLPIVIVALHCPLPLSFCLSEESLPILCLRVSATQLFLIPDCILSCRKFNVVPDNTEMLRCTEYVKILGLVADNTLIDVRTDKHTLISYPVLTTTLNILYLSWEVFLLVIWSCIHGMWYVFSCYTILCWFLNQFPSHRVCSKTSDQLFIMIQAQL